MSTSLRVLPLSLTSLAPLNCSGCTFIVKNSSDVIPVGTTYVIVANKKIERLPPLPDSLIRLECSHCTSLSELPDLPVSLTHLYCYGCTSLHKLPPLPVSLKVLNCSGCTSLSKLPHLPASLKLLLCWDCTSLRELPSLPIGLTELYCSGCILLLYLPIIPDDCNYTGPSLPTEEKYFKEVNMGANQEFVGSRGDALSYRILGKNITYMVKEYLSFGKTRKSKGKGNPKKRKSSRRKKSR
jgi:hypothetical protein